MNEIERLQEHLLLIRRTVGWTAEEFGERIGVTRQTINNLEAGPSILVGSTSRNDVSKEMMAVAGGIGIPAAAGHLFAPAAIIGGATSAWLLKTIFDKKNRRTSAWEDM